MKFDKNIGVRLYSDETGFTVEFYKVPRGLSDLALGEYARRVAKRDYPESAYLGWEDMLDNTYHKPIN